MRPLHPLCDAVRPLAVVLPQLWDLCLLPIASTNSLCAMPSKLRQIHRLRSSPAPSLSLDRGQWRTSSDHHQRRPTRRTLSTRSASNALPSLAGTILRPALAFEDDPARRDCAGVYGGDVDLARDEATPRCAVSVSRSLPAWCLNPDQYTALQRPFLVLLRPSVVARHSSPSFPFQRRYFCYPPRPTTLAMRWAPRLRDGGECPRLVLDLFALDLAYAAF
ncbi:hypothetical protein C8R45DRAFT_603745 [Mycena sanguinolenta]|nr:hypothetical protein C8R45DRAFT_603745 [Mycena sanguinolenta]